MKKKVYVLSMALFAVCLSVAAEGKTVSNAKLPKHYVVWWKSVLTQPQAAHDVKATFCEYTNSGKLLAERVVNDIHGDTILSINSDKKAKKFTVKVEFVLTDQGPKNTLWFDNVYPIKSKDNVYLLERDMSPVEPKVTNKQK